MERNEQSYIAAHRGTIIVDTNALLLLHARTAQYPTSPRYLDVLRFLGEEGFRIIIPDTVAFEVERVLPSGESLNHAFRSRLRIHRPDLEQFLLDVAHERCPNIIIHSVHGPKRIAAALDKLQQALWYHHKGGYNGHTGRHDSLEKIQTLQGAIVGDKLQSGDDVIEYLLAHRGEAIIRRKPVFLLTDDIEFMKDFARRGRHPKVGLLSTGGLLEALCAAGLHRRIYATQHLQNAHQMKLDCYWQKEFLQAAAKASAASDAEEQTLRITEHPGIDCLAEEHRLFKGSASNQRVSSSPFAQSMQALEKALSPAEPKYSGDQKAPKARHYANGNRRKYPPPSVTNNHFSYQR